MAAIVPTRGCSFARFTGGNFGADQSSGDDLRGFDFGKIGRFPVLMGTEENHAAASERKILSAESSESGASLPFIKFFSLIIRKCWIAICLTISELVISTRLQGRLRRQNSSQLWTSTPAKQFPIMQRSIKSPGWISVQVPEEPVSILSFYIKGNIGLW